MAGAGSETSARLPGRWWGTGPVGQVHRAQRVDRSSIIKSLIWGARGQKLQVLLPHPKPPVWPVGHPVTCLRKLRVCWAAVVARMVWLLPGLGRRERARLATTWACSCVMLTLSSVTVSSVSPSTDSVRGETT